MQQEAVLSGADAIGDNRRLLAGRRLGLVANHASLDRSLVPTAARLAAVARLVRLFAPEHGWAGAADAGAAIDDGVDPATGLPVIALYGRRTAPAPEHLTGLDAVVVDLPDVGVRAYTYLATTLGVLGAAAAADVQVIVLDRPNPLGRTCEGGGVAYIDRMVAPIDVPLRHGLTLGELARLHCAQARLPAPEVIPADGWSGGPRPFEQPWVAPSPNLPTVACAIAYAGTVLVEGTALSEGRGTTRPFTLVGAPGIDAESMAEAVGPGLVGMLARPARFVPAASKHLGRCCAGIELHILDGGRQTLALPAVLAILAHVRDRHPGALGVGPFLTRLAAGPELAAWCATPGAPPGDLLAAWAPAACDFASRAAPHLLYPPGP